MNEQITFEIGPDGEILNPREPLPAFWEEYLQPGRWVPTSEDGWYHRFADDGSALCHDGSVRPGQWAGNGDWRLVNCPDCREIGQARQPLLNMTVPDIGAVAGELADAMNERIQAIGAAAGPIVDAVVEAQNEQIERLAECFREKDSSAEETGA